MDFANIYNAISGDYINVRDEITADVLSFQKRGWSIIASEIWMMYRYNRKPIPDQGWKGHLSCTLVDLEKMLHTAIPVLMEQHCSFKVIRNRKLAQIINDIHYPVSGANKMITFYPTDEAHFRKVMRKLYHATLSFQAPPVFTDMGCGLNTALHYRYGAFRDISRTDPLTGETRHYIKSPAGDLIEDRRDPWFQMPPFVSFPFHPKKDVAFFPEYTMVEDTKLSGYEFEGIISRSNKGNVYLAAIKGSDFRVIIKEAHKNVRVGKNKDMQDVLHNEYQMLKKLASTGMVPEVYDYFSCPGHSYLIEEYIDGISLSKYAAQTAYDPTVSHAGVVKQLYRLVSQIHDRNIVINDLSPNNFMLDKNRRLYLIDVEFAFDVHDKVKDRVDLKTIGYNNPEITITDKRGGDVYKPDYFAAVISEIAIHTGRTPFFHPDHRFAAERRPVSEKVSDLIAIAVRSNRLSPGESRNAIKMLALSGYEKKERKEKLTKNSLLKSGKSYLRGLKREIEKSIAADENRLFRSTGFGNNTMACNIQHGLAGVVSSLVEMTAIAELTETASELLELIHPFFVETERYIAEDDPAFLFGLGGYYWSLLDYAGHINDDALMLKVLQLIRDIRIPEQEPDVALGQAGIGNLMLKAWTVSHDSFYLEKAVDIAQCVKNDATRLLDAKGTAVGTGYAHGYAGVLHFIYMTGQISGKKTLRQFAVKKLRDKVLPVVNSMMQDYYEEHKGVDVSWCKGLSGIGTALVRINRYENSEDIWDYCRKIAECITSSMWMQSDCICHGNAGSLEFLMDALDETGESIYEGYAHELANYLFTHRYFKEKDQLQFPDETMLSARYDYGVGSMGVFRSLLRAKGLINGRLFIL